MSSFLLSLQFLVDPEESFYPETILPAITPPSPTAEAFFLGDFAVLLDRLHTQIPFYRGDFHQSDRSVGVIWSGFF